MQAVSQLLGIRMPLCYGPESSGRVRVPSSPQEGFPFGRLFLFSMFFVYILQSLQDQTFYIGYTTDVERRLSQHNEGLSRYTKSKMPWKMVYTEVFETKTEALRREIFLKKQRNSSFYQSLVDAGSVPITRD